MQRIDSAHSIWLFDADRMVFRRVPKGTDPMAPSPESEWQPYFALDVDADTGAFTVALNHDRTRLLRAWRDDATVAADGELPTGELRLEAEAVE